MKLVRSARARIALITALVCAVVLGAFAVAAWSRLKAARIEALDRELESAGISLALSARMSLPATTAERLLNQRFGTEREKGRAFSVMAQGEKAVLSSQWPAGLDPATLPHNPGTFEREMGGPPDDGGPRSRAVPPDGGDGQSNQCWQANGTGFRRFANQPSGHHSDLALEMFMPVAGSLTRTSASEPEPRTPSSTTMCLCPFAYLPDTQIGP